MLFTFPALTPSSVFNANLSRSRDYSESRGVRGARRDVEELSSQPWTVLTVIALGGLFVPCNYLKFPFDIPPQTAPAAAEELYLTTISSWCHVDDPEPETNGGLHDIAVNRGLYFADPSTIGLSDRIHALKCY